MALLAELSTERAVIFSGEKRCGPQVHQPQSVAQTLTRTLFLSQARWPVEIMRMLFRVNFFSILARVARAAAAADCALAACSGCA